jgi:CoA:oxalate CoA-transferase
MTKPLEGIKVLEFANFIAGPFCGMLLADMGAEVIKIESLSGDMSRAIPPIIDGESAAFINLNRNKKSLALDLKTDLGKEVVFKLVGNSDVFLENNRPGAMDRLGLGYDKIKEIKPDIVYTAVSGFGQTGPHRNRGGVNLIIEALAGTLSVMGEKGQMPVRPGIQTADMFGALFATYATLTSLVGKEKHGEGKFSDVSLVEASIASAVWETAEYLSTGNIPEQIGHSHRASAPYQLFETKDKKFIAIGAPNDLHFQRLMTVLSCAEHIGNKAFSSYSSRKENENILVPIVSEGIVKWNASDLEEALMKEGVPCGYVRNYEQAINSEHSVDRGLVVESDHNVLGKIKSIRNPVLMNEDGPDIRNSAPLLGQDSYEILTELGFIYQELKDKKVTL